MASKTSEKSEWKKREEKNKIPSPLTRLSDVRPALAVAGRRLKKIGPIGDFKPKEGVLNVNDVVDEAKQKLALGAARPDSEVNIILPDEKGQPGMEREMPLSEVAKIQPGNKVYDELKGAGGWVTFDDDGGGGSLKTDAARYLYGIAAKLVLPQVKSGEMSRKQAARNLLHFASAASDTLSGAIPPQRLRAALSGMDSVGGSERVAAAAGGGYEFAGLGKPNMPPRWFLMGEASKMGFLWMLDQHKYRFQYSLISDYITLPWARRDYYGILRKKRKKRKKLSDLEKRLDIFDINIEDIFDIDSLGMHEIFELDDLEKVEPSMDEYNAMAKLMKEEGYYDYAEATKTFGEGHVR